MREPVTVVLGRFGALVGRGLRKVPCNILTFGIPLGQLNCPGPEPSVPICLTYSRLELSSSTRSLPLSTTQMFPLGSTATAPGWSKARPIGDRKSVV